MDAPSMESYLTGRTPETAPPPPPRPPARSGGIPEGVKTGLLFALLAATAYLLYAHHELQLKTVADLAKISEQIRALENLDKAGEAKLTTLKGELSQTLGSTKQELLRKTAATAAQMQAESSRTKSELTQAISSKADAEQVQALRHEAETKIGQVSTEVGGVKTEVGTVKTDLAATRKDLEGTQRQLVDVHQTLQAAVAKNSSELNELRRKGERDYFEFEIPKKNLLTKVEDIRLILNKTDAKKGKYSMTVVVDDNKLEKRDRTVNEPVQFLVGRNRLRYEVVVNWVQKDRIGGYLSTPKDKALAAERASATASTK